MVLTPITYDHCRVMALLHWTVAATITVFLLARQSSFAAAVALDPAVPLTNYWSVEWNTNGNLEGWTASNITNSTVAGGALTGASSTADPQIQLLNFAAGPDLDLAFNDFLDLRIQVPAGYTGNIQVFYGTTNTTGISGSRVLTIPNSSIPADGAFHTYRLDLALEQAWRGNLRDLRIDPVSVAGASFAIDFIRIGDLTGDIYHPNTTDQAVTTNELSSKHFRFIWDLNRATNNGMNADWAHGNLRNAEEVWAVYVKALGYREPSESTDIARRDGRKYKVNFLCTYDGYWMGGSPTSFGYMNIEPSGLRVDPPSWVTPHEGMHVFQMHQGGSMPGEWWECHANYGRERWVHFYDTLFAGQSGIDAGAVENGQMMMAIGRDYYLTWPFFLYLDENPDGLPDLGEGVTAKIWQTNAGGVYAYTTLEQLTTNTSVKDVVGYYARRMVTFDFARQTAITNALNSQNPSNWRRYQISELQRRADDTNWWRVPMEMAPQQGGYAIHELAPIGTNKVVSVNFRGLPDAARGADWRAGFVAIASDGTERYTPLWNAGTNTITLAASETRLCLVVAATPNPFIYGGHDDLAYPYRSHPSKQRHHYEVRVFNAAPKVSNNGSTSGLVQHTNGGGWKASTATVDATAYLGPNARVLGTAKVRNNARIEDFAVVQNSATVSNNAVVSGHALVRDSAVVRDNAKVRDWATVGSSAIVRGNSRVLEHAKITDGTVSDFATAKGAAFSQGGLALGGYGVIDGDFLGGRVVTNGFAYGHQPYVGVPDSWVRVAPDRLYAAYEFTAANDSLTRDLYGVADGYLLGSPVWRSNDLRRAGVLMFDGASQYVALDKSLCDWPDLSIATWLKWNGGAPGQVLWHFGSATNRCMFLTPDDGSGTARFVIRSNTTEFALAGGALSPGVWTHLAVTLSNGVGRLFVNGALTAQAAVGIRPDQLLGGNTNTAPQHHYLARGADEAAPFFSGALDSVRVYSKALSTEEISWLYSPPPNAGTLYVDLRATNASALTATWANEGALGHFTKVGAPFFTNNVAGTGVPGISFSGSGQAYQGPNSVSDIEGGSDRSIEVWAYNPALAEEETTISWGHRSYVRQNMGFNFGSHASWGAATHWGDDTGWGTAPTANAWHHLAYTYSATTVKVYVDGALRNTDSLGGTLDTFTNEPINLACQRDSANGTRSLHFSGFLNAVRVHGGLLTDEQIANNYVAGPWMFVASNTPPTVALTNPLPNSFVNVPDPVNLAAVAQDPDGTVTNIEFFADGTNLGQDTSAPYSLSTTNLALGSHALTAVATDNAGLRATSAVVQVTILPPVALTLISTGSVWNYFDRTNDLGIAWRAPDYNDGSWSNGPAQLGYGDGDEATPVVSNRARITTYFRRAFVVPTNSVFFSAAVRVLRDDGAAGYLNGVEVFRSNMPTNVPIGWATQAVTAATGGDETTNFYHYTVSAAPLQPGTNVMAVEVHQNGTASTDLSFDLALFVTNVSAQFNTPPTISAVADQTVTEDMPLLLLPFAIGDAESPADTLVVSARAADTNLVPTLALTGSASNRFLSVWPAPDANGTTTITLTVSDGFATTTNRFQLTVTSVNDPPAVALTNPTNGATLPPGTFMLAATAGDVDDAIARVEFFLDGAKVGEDTNAPFTAALASLPGGYHKLSAQATDASGANTWSTPASVTINWAPLDLVTNGSDWKYNDLGSNLGTAWSEPDYNDALWPAGPAPLGYGDANGLAPRTTNSFGTNAANKYITTYYRRAFVLPDVPAWSSASVSIRRDDGAIVYLNGVETFRSNMTNGPVNYLTRATNAVSGAAETTWYSNSFNPALLVPGTNTLAVEIHQDRPDSSDIFFDLRLTGQPTNAVLRLETLPGSPVFTLHWPAWAAGVVLESTTNLTPPVSWQPSGVDGFLTNGHWAVTPPANATGNFFRLRAP